MGRGGEPPPRELVQFTDRRGVPWTVREVSCADLPSGRGRDCLIFESEGAVRRVWQYPDGWRELPPAELEALSWKR